MMPSGMFWDEWFAIAGIVAIGFMALTLLGWLVEEQ